MLAVAAARSAAAVIVLAVAMAALYQPAPAVGAPGVRVVVEGFMDLGVDPVAAPLSEGYTAVIATDRGLLAVSPRGYEVVDSSVRAQLVSGIDSAGLPGGGSLVALVQGGELRVYTFSGGSWEAVSHGLAGLGLEAPYRLLGLVDLPQGAVALVAYRGGVAAIDPVKGAEVGRLSWRGIGVESLEAYAVGDGYAVLCGGGSVVLLAVDEEGLRIAGRAPAPRGGCRGAYLLGGYVAAYNEEYLTFYEAPELDVVEAFRASGGYRIAGAALVEAAGEAVGIAALEGPRLLVYAVSVEDDGELLGAVELEGSRLLGIAAAGGSLAAVAYAAGDHGLRIALLEAGSGGGLRVAWIARVPGAFSLGGETLLLAARDGFVVVGPVAAAVQGVRGSGASLLLSAGTAEQLAASAGYAAVVHSGSGYSYAYIVDVGGSTLEAALSLESAVVGASPFGVAVAGASSGGIVVASLGPGGLRVVDAGVEGEPVAVEPGDGVAYLAVAAGGSLRLYSLGPDGVSAEVALEGGDVELAASPGGALAAAVRGWILLLNPESLEVEERLEAPEGEPAALEWSPSGYLLAVYASEGSGELVVLGPWGRASAELDHRPLDAAWLGDDKVAVVLEGGLLAVYSLEAGELRLLGEEEAGVVAVEALNGERLLALGGPATLSIVEVAVTPRTSTTTSGEVTTTVTETETVTATVTSTVTVTETETRTETVTVTATETETDTLTVTAVHTVTETLTETVTEVELETVTATSTYVETVTVVEPYTVTEAVRETVTKTETVAAPAATQTVTETETVTMLVEPRGPSPEAVLLALAIIAVSAAAALAIDRRRGGG